MDVKHKAREYVSEMMNEYPLTVQEALDGDLGALQGLIRRAFMMGASWCASQTAGEVGR